MNKNLNFTINLDFKGKRDIEIIIDKIAEEHNLKVNSNISDLNAKLKTTQSRFKVVRDNIANFGFALQGIGTIFNTLKNSLGEIINLTRNQEKAENLVAGAIKATGSAAGYSLVELKKFASELQNISNYGDEEILTKVINPLLTFKNVKGNEFKLATKAILDMSAALGTDLQQSAIQVGKALQDTVQGVSALRRVGVQLNDEQEKRIKQLVSTNQLTKAQNIILKELASEFGGQAKNIADPIIQLQNTLGDLGEAIGAFVLPSLNILASALKNVANNLIRTKSEVEKVTETSHKQQKKFEALIELYKTYRYEQGLNSNNSEALKNVIAQLHSSYSVYLGDIDLATVKYDKFTLAVSSARNALIAEATQKLVNAKQSTLVNDIAELEVNKIDEAIKVQDKINEQKKNIQKAQENVYNQQQKYQKMINNGYAGVALTSSSKKVELASKTLIRERKELDRLIDKKKDIDAQFTKDITDKKKILSENRKKYADLLDDNDKENINVSSPKDKTIAVEKQLNDEIELIKKSFLTKKELIDLDYQHKKEIINKEISNEEKKKELLTNLDKSYKQDCNDLNIQNFQQYLSQAETKKELGILTYAALKKEVAKYYNFVKKEYGKDSKEYTEALNMMRNVNLRYGQEQKKISDNTISYLKNKWIMALEQFKNCNEVSININIKDNVKEQFNNYVNFLNNKLKEVKEHYLDIIKVPNTEPEELNNTIEEINQLTESIKNLKDQYNKLVVNDNKLSRFISRLNNAIDGLSDQTKFMVNTISEAFANMFLDIEQRGFHLKKQLKNVWKSIAYSVVQEINRMIARWLVFSTLKGLGGFLGFSSGGLVNIDTNTLTPSGPVYVASGGHVTGPGTATSDSIPARLSNGEYVINAEKTKIFRGLLDYINWTPLSRISKVIIPNIPHYTLPAVPKVSYASGGIVNNSFNLSNLESKLDILAKKLDRIEQKEMEVKIVTKFKGVQFYREVKKAEEQYKRSIL